MAKQQTDIRDNVDVMKGVPPKFKPMLTLSGTWGRCVFCPADVVRMNADRMNKRIIISFAGTVPVPDMVLNFLQVDEFTATADTLCAAINHNEVES